MHQNQNDHQPWLFLPSQLMSEGMVEDYWERVKSHHIHNYNKSNSTNNTNTSTNSTKVFSKSPRHPLHPKFSPLRMPPRGWWANKKKRIVIGKTLIKWMNLYNGGNLAAMFMNFLCQIKQITKAEFEIVTTRRVSKIVTIVVCWRPKISSDDIGGYF